MYSTISTILNTNIQSIDDFSDKDYDQLNSILIDLTRELSKLDIKNMKTLNIETKDILLKIQTVNKCIDFVLDEGY
tara:strand:+ start:3073 stop:3300 length:228 start_codon:yes stop_codon:yes gene_type:complete